MAKSVQEKNFINYVVYLNNHQMNAAYLYNPEHTLALKELQDKALCLMKLFASSESKSDIETLVLESWQNVAANPEHLDSMLSCGDKAAGYLSKVIHNEIIKNGKNKKKNIEMDDMTMDYVSNMNSESESVDPELMEKVLKLTLELAKPLEFYSMYSYAVYGWTNREIESKIEETGLDKSIQELLNSPKFRQLCDSNYIDYSEFDKFRFAQTKHKNDYSSKHISNRDIGHRIDRLRGKIRKRISLPLLD